MQTNNKVALVLVGIPLIIFIILMLVNMPNAFSHCWLGSCVNDLNVGVIGIAIVLVGIITFLLPEQNDEFINENE